MIAGEELLNLNSSAAHQPDRSHPPGLSVTHAYPMAVEVCHEDIRRCQASLAPACLLVIHKALQGSSGESLLLKQMGSRHSDIQLEPR